MVPGCAQNARASSRDHSGIAQPRSIALSAAASAGPVFGLLRETREEDSVERGRDLGAFDRGRDRRLVQVLAADLHQVRPVEDMLTGEQVIRGRAERVDVGAAVDIRRIDDRLWCHVVGRAEDRVDVAHVERRLLTLLHEPEVEDLHDVGYTAAVGEHDVRGLDVTMDEADRVRLFERAAYLPEDVHHAGRRLRSVLLDEALQRHAVEVLHRVVEDAVRRAAVVVDRDGVRVREARGDLHLALEALCGMPRAPREQLDGGGAAEHRVARAIDDPHGAFPDLVLEHVLPELHRLADLELQSVDDV